jgi:hypothetical protein
MFYKRKSEEREEGKATISNRYFSTYRFILFFLNKTIESTLERRKNAMGLSLKSGVENFRFDNFSSFHAFKKIEVLDSKTFNNFLHVQKLQSLHVFYYSLHVPIKIEKVFSFVRGLQKKSVSI